MTDTMTLRVAPETKDLVRQFARLAAERPERAADLLRQLGGNPIEPDSVGPFRNEEAAVAYIRDRLICAFKPEQIWLFGSRARRDHRRDSDFDILLVLADGLPDQMYDYGHALDAVSGVGIPIEIVTCSASEFAAGTATSGSLAEVVAREGRLLHRRRESLTAP